MIGNYYTLTCQLSPTERSHCQFQQGWMVLVKVAEHDCDGSGDTNVINQLIYWQFASSTFRAELTSLK